MIPKGVKSSKLVEECKDSKITKEKAIREIESKKSFEDLCIKPKKKNQ